MAAREYYAELPSTQDRALELARSGAEEGTAVVARCQTSGRGRGDRRWDSPEGGLYLSVVLRPQGPTPLMPLAIGAELVGAYSLEYGTRLRLKWPNDVLGVDRGGSARKLAGVLVDEVHDPARQSAWVAGVGVNAQAGLERTALRAEATSLEQLTGLPVDLDRLERVTLAAVLGARRALDTPEGSAAIVALGRGLLYGRGASVLLDDQPIGTVRGLGDDGGLEVGTATGVRVVHSGHLRLGVGA